MHDQPSNTSKLVPNADDFTAGDTLTESKFLWNILCDLESLDTTHELLDVGLSWKE